MLFRLFLYCAVVSAGTPRISRENIDLSTPKSVYLSEGLVSVVEFPKNISEVRLGDTRVVKALISEKSPRELSLFLKSKSFGATNIIVRAERSVFVMDIVPSVKTHQDFIKVSGAFGGPNFKGNEIEKRVIGPETVLKNLKVLEEGLIK